MPLTVHFRRIQPLHCPCPEHALRAALSICAAAHTTLDAIARGEALGLLSGFLSLLSGFLSLLRTSETSRQHTDTQREELQALYPEAQALAADICDTVEFFYRHDLEPSSRRTKSRRWGVVYFYEPNEPRDEGDPTGPGTGGVTPPPTPQ